MKKETVTNLLYGHKPLNSNLYTVTWYARLVQAWILEYLWCKQLC